MKVDVKIQSVHFDADKKLLNFIQGRVDKLTQFYDKITGGEVFLRLDKNDKAQNKIVEIKLLIPGSDLFAKKQSASFEESADSAVEAIRRQIVKRKGKMAVA